MYICFNNYLRECYIFVVGSTTYLCCYRLRDIAAVTMTSHVNGRYQFWTPIYPNNTIQFNTIITFVERYLRSVQERWQKLAMICSAK